MGPKEILVLDTNVLVSAVGWQGPEHRLSVVRLDPDDNRVLECAVEARAGWIVSGDPHLLELTEYRASRIVGAREALESLGLE